LPRRSRQICRNRRRTRPRRTARRRRTTWLGPRRAGFPVPVDVDREQWCWGRTSCCSLPTRRRSHLPPPRPTAASASADRSTRFRSERSECPRNGRWSRALHPVLASGPAADRRRWSSRQQADLDRVTPPRYHPQPGCCCECGTGTHCARLGLPARPHAFPRPKDSCPKYPWAIPRRGVAGTGRSASAAD